MQSIQPRPQLMAMYGAPGDGNSAAYPRAAEAWHGPTLSVEEDDLGKGGGGVRGDARLVVEIVLSISADKGSGHFRNVWLSGRLAAASALTAPPAQM
jgi:hypothetical protein